MKLVRLTKSDFATNSSGIFNNDFNDGIKIPPNSKIALQSVSADLVEKSLIIDTTNNGINFEIKSGFPRTTEMTSFTYNISNSDGLLLNVAKSLNNALRWEAGLNKVLGMEFNGSVGNDGKVNIEYRIGAAGEYGNPQLGDLYAWQVGKKTNVTGDSAGGQGVYGMTTGEPASDVYTNVINNKRIISKGNGYFRCRINTLADTGTTATNGFIIALSTFFFDPSIYNFQEKFIDYGLKVTIDNATGNLQYIPIEKGVQGAVSAVVPSAVTPNGTGNDVLEVTIDGSAVDINVYQGAAATKQQITTLTYDRKLSGTGAGGKGLRPTLIFFGDRTNASATDVRWTPSTFDPAFVNNPNNNLVSVSQPHNGAVVPPTNNNPVNETNNFLQFASKQVATYLGFTHERIPRTGTIRASTPCVFQTDDQIPYHISYEVRGFIIQLLNIKVNSFDAFRNQRENLLAIIPSLDVSGQLVYTVPTPYFIELNNPKELLLRNVKARLCNLDYSDVILDGFGQISLLID
jgi:hypothetical protein